VQPSFRLRQGARGATSERSTDGAAVDPQHHGKIERIAGGK
jgi:hypothetical protein